MPRIGTRHETYDHGMEHASHTEGSWCVVHVGMYRAMLVVMFCCGLMFGALLMAVAIA